MQKMTIKKSIEINASSEMVWEVLLDDKYNRLWFAEFSEGTRAQTDWTVGSKAIFADESKSGLIGKIIANKPSELLSIEYAGQLINNVEDYDSDIAKAIKGGKEVYRLTEVNGKTNLDIECDMGDEMFDMMSESWQKALQKIKQLAETQEQIQA